MKNKKLAIVGCTIVAIILVVLTVCIIILGLIGKSSRNSTNNSNNSTSTPPAANSDLATYTNTASNFQLMYSKSEWSYVENQDNVVVIFKGPKENDTDLIATNFNVNKFAADSTTDVYTSVDTEIKSFSTNSAVSEYNLISKDKLMIAGSTNAVKITYTAKINGTSVKQTQYYFVVNNTLGFVVTYTGTPTGHDKYLPDFNKIISTFQVNK